MKSIPKAALTAAIMLAAITAAIIMAAMPWAAAEAQDLDVGMQTTALSAPATLTTPSTER